MKVLGNEGIFCNLKHMHIVVFKYNIYNITKINSTSVKVVVS